MIRLGGLRRSFRVAPVDASSSKSGPVQKLVLKGDWQGRKWNDRWLELGVGELRYCWKEGHQIDRIAARSIQCIKTLDDPNGGLEVCNSEEMQEEVQTMSSLSLGSFNSSMKNLASVRSIWPMIARNGVEYRYELENGFLLQTGGGNQIGREYFFRTNSRADSLRWIGWIKTMIRDAQPRPKTAYSIARTATRNVFETAGYTVVTTMLILLNFSAYVFDTQVHCPESD
jgi:hypothetical protein